MARPREFTQQNTALATQAANVGMNWFHQIAEQNFKQCKASLEELLGLNLRMAADFGNKQSAICAHSRRLQRKRSQTARLRETQELAQVQTDFLSRQSA